MTSYVQGLSREQATLFPERLDEVVGANAVVRVIDAFVNREDLQKLGFEKAVPARTGRPAFDPRDLLKLYVYGYMNRVRSSRRLEQECVRNVEVMWLLGKLQPDFKTIADFRRDNRKAIVAVCRALVQFCREAHLVGGELVAIDGTKVAGQNGRGRAWTAEQLKRAEQKTDKQIASYLAQLDSADADGPGEEPAGDVQAALKKLREKKAEIAQSRVLMEELERKQVALTDPDARVMPSAQGGMVVGFNVQAAVDGRHGLIVHHEVTQATSDQHQLAAMAEAAKDALAVETLEVVADAGYGVAEQIKRCEDAGITPYVPHPRSVNTTGLFDKARFVYDPQSDTYQCPAGRLLHNVGGSEVKRQTNYRARSCEGCVLKPRCTKRKVRWVTRHRNEDVLERNDARLKLRPGIMKIRSTLAEHPFGIIKDIWGAGRFLCRGLQAVRAEAALSVLAFNLRRLVTILGVKPLIERIAVA